MEITHASYLISSPSVDKCPKADRPEYAFIGRSNVGKSSVINMLTNKKELAKVSSSPGKTQLINHFDIVSGDKKKWWLVDLPGYGYAKRSQSMRKSWQKMIEEYIRKRENLVYLFVLIDSRHGPQALDLQFVNQLGEWQIPFALIFTKADKSTVKETANNVNDFLRELLKTWESAPPHFVTSAVKRTGAKQVLTFISQGNDAYEAAHKKGMV
jgi:GTP-binding protein